MDMDDNWARLIKECEGGEGLFDKKFQDKNGKVYRFAGLVHDNEDYSYLMLDKEGRALFLSCVGTFDMHGFKQL